MMGLLIGGTRDGDRIDLLEPEPFLEVMSKPNEKAFARIETREIYRREAVATPTSRIIFYVAEGLSTTTALAQVFRNYRPA